MEKANLISILGFCYIKTKNINDRLCRLLTFLSETTLKNPENLRAIRFIYFKLHSLFREPYWALVISVMLLGLRQSFPLEIESCQKNQNDIYFGFFTILWHVWLQFFSVVAYYEVRKTKVLLLKKNSIFDYNYRLKKTCIQIWILSFSLFSFFLFVNLFLYWSHVLTPLKKKKKKSGNKVAEMRK